MLQSYVQTHDVFLLCAIVCGGGIPPVTPTLVILADQTMFIQTFSFKKSVIGFVNYLFSLKNCLHGLELIEDYLLAARAIHYQTFHIHLFALIKMNLTLHIYFRQNFMNFIKKHHKK